MHHGMEDAPGLVSSLWNDLPPSACSLMLTGATTASFRCLSLGVLCNKKLASLKNLASLNKSFPLIVLPQSSKTLSHHKTAPSKDLSLIKIFATLNTREQLGRHFLPGNKSKYLNVL